MIIRSDRIIRESSSSKNVTQYYILRLALEYRAVKKNKYSFTALHGKKLNHKHVSVKELFVVHYYRICK